MYQQIRAMINYGVTGMWVYGWGPSSEHASARWTQSGTERYAEAIERERNSTAGVVPKPSQNAFLNPYPNPFTANSDPLVTGDGIWLPFELAQRKAVTFRVYTTGGSLVRDIDLGYSFSSVEGRYENHPTNQLNKSSGTAGHWDGKNNSGQVVANGLYTISMYVNGVLVGSKQVQKTT